MTIKDFTVGQTAYVYNTDRRENPKKGYAEVTVAKIGRSYVTLGDGWGRRFGVGYGGNYLVEKVDAGSPAYLFRTKQDLDDYLEAEKLRVEVRQAMDWWNLQRLPLSKLRAIKAILDNADDDGGQGE